MHFKKLKKEHLKDMYEVRFSVHENLVHSHQIKYLVREKALEDVSQGGGWCCYIDDTFVGYAFGLFIPEPIIGGLFVKPEFQNLGIGSILLEKVTEWFFEQRVNEINLTTDRGSKAELFYIKHGWIHDGEDEFGQVILVKKNET